MAELSISCSSCQAEYALPDSYRQHLEGRAVFCVDCQRWWVAVPAASGPTVRLVKGRPERAPIDLRPFRRGAPTVASPAPSPAAPAAPPTGGLDATARVPLSMGAPAATPARPPSLRVVVSTPGKDVKAVFALGGKSFLIGQQHCHLNLKQAAVPEKAIRIRSERPGLSV